MGEEDIISSDSEHATSRSNQRKNLHEQLNSRAHVFNQAGFHAMNESVSQKINNGLANEGAAGRNSSFSFQRKRSTGDL